tara:strand:+ start:1526 stop:1693 length:168 start_codon:yes stop_codon:yes gene_type:complete
MVQRLDEQLHAMPMLGGERVTVQAQCSDCVHFFISYFKECGTCGTHLHDDGRTDE